MRISVKNGEKQTPADGLWSALGVDERLRMQKDQPVILSFVGGGGKTSYIRRLAWEGRQKGLRMLVMTTTHMAEPEHFAVLEPDVKKVKDLLNAESIAVAGHPVKNQKIAFWDEDFYKKALKLADVVLIEADGSKRLPVKVPGENEPVIPEDTSAIVCLSGLGALGKKAESCCFRLVQSEALLDLKEEEKKGRWIMTEEKMAYLMTEGYLKPLRKAFPDSQVIMALNQADTMEAEEQGRHILEMAGEEKGILTGKLYEELSFNLF